MPWLGEAGSDGPARGQGERRTDDDGRRLCYLADVFVCLDELLDACLRRVLVGGILERGERGVAYYWESRLV